MVMEEEEEEGFQVSSDDDSNFKGLSFSKLFCFLTLSRQARREKSFNAIICQKSNESSLFF